MSTESTEWIICYDIGQIYNLPETNSSPLNMMGFQ